MKARGEANINANDNYGTGESDAYFFSLLTICAENRYLEESYNNALGYESLMKLKNPETTILLFRANTIVHPNSANAFDSFGEVLTIKIDLK